MAMGTRKERGRQEDFWVAHMEIASTPSYPFYRRLNELLEGEKFDEFVEGRLQPSSRKALTSVWR
jgi:hypothetical protein